MSAAADWPIMAGLSADGPAGLALLAGAAAAAGAINSVAGGGTILTSGVPLTVADMNNRACPFRSPTALVPPTVLE